MTILELIYGVGGIAVGYLGVPVLKTIVGQITADVSGLFSHAASSVTTSTTPAAK
jgi:hypothetical protein